MRNAAQRVSGVPLVRFKLGLAFVSDTIPGRNIIRESEHCSVDNKKRGKL